jgi:hypothetical protein
MAKVNFNAEHKKVLDALLLQLPDVTAGKMFGYRPITSTGSSLPVFMVKALALRCPKMSPAIC